jgi:hypothetical protein
MEVVELIPEPMVEHRFVNFYLEEGRNITFRSRALAERKQSPTRERLAVFKITLTDGKVTEVELDT